MGSFSSGHDGFGGGVGAPTGGREVAAVWNDVGMRQWRGAGQILVLHLVSGGTELIDDASDMDAVFQISTALERRLRQLALFITSS